MHVIRLNEKTKDESIRKKYAYMAPIDVATADGVKFSVAATTYIDEFSQPVKITENVINSSIEKAIS